MGSGSQADRQSEVSSARPSLVRGQPLSTESGLGTLTLPGFLREVTERFAAREALVQTHADGTVERWTYGELWNRTMSVAQALVAGGLAKDERVGVLMTNRAEMIAALFGISLAGGVATPLSTFSTAEELGFLLERSAVSALLFERRVLQRDFLGTLELLEPAIRTARAGAFSSRRFPFLRRLAMADGDAHAGCVEPWRDFLATGETVDVASVEARAASVAPADSGMIFFSSGSTGKPKAILSSQRGVAIQLWRMHRQQGLGDDVRTWTANGFFWSGNFAMIVGGTLAAGGTIVLQSVFRAEEALTLMARERVSFLFAWPHQWAQLLGAANWNDVDLSALEYVDVDNPIAHHPTVTSDWIEPRHCYGNTETFTLSTAYPAGTSRATARDSHGVPLPGNILKIVDPLTSDVVPVGECGEIAIKGPTLMLGYLGVPAEDAFDEEGFFRTGDGGYVDDDGRLYWQGRLNDIIKTGGANVSPLEVDDVVRGCPGVKMAQTVGVPHETLGEMVVTCIVPLEDSAIDEQSVRAYVRERLASYKTPRRVLCFREAELTMTGSAKIKTEDLRALAAERLAAS